jgi:hypothetical protein
MCMHVLNLGSLSVLGTETGLTGNPIGRTGTYEAQTGLIDTTTGLADLAVPDNLVLENLASNGLE